jgi:hypothetical protein
MADLGSPSPAQTVDSHSAVARVLEPGQALVVAPVRVLGPALVLVRAPGPVRVLGQGRARVAAAGPVLGRVRAHRRKADGHGKIEHSATSPSEAGRGRLA